ncbi:MAG: hypothetical protein R3F30_16090 [Planctomycetota bacterium]
MPTRPLRAVLLPVLALATFAAAGRQEPAPEPAQDPEPAPATRPGPGFAWREDLAAARKEARATGRPLLLYYRCVP